MIGFLGEKNLEEYIKNCERKKIEWLYENQYKYEDLIPSIDYQKEEGKNVYMIYCYKDNTKYLCRVFK